MWDEFVGSPFVRASTMFHELGHNLGLFHGGLPPIWGDKTKNPPTATYIEPNCKPNYLSSMSYLFQVNGLLDNLGQLHLDYSGTANSNVDEKLLSDGPLGPTPPSYIPAWFAPFSSPLATTQSAPSATRFCNGSKFDPSSPPAPAMARVEAATPTASIDWDGGSNLIGAQNVNFDGTTSGARIINSTVQPDDSGDRPLFGFNDWANIRLDQMGDLPDTKTNADGLGELADIFGGDIEGVFGGDIEGVFGGDVEGIFGGDVEGLFGGDVEGIFGGDVEGIFGGNELTIEQARGVGASRPHAFTACLIGAPGCAPGTQQTKNEVLTNWKTSTFGHVVGYHVYRVAGATVTPANLATKVEVPGSPTKATTLIDPTNLPSNRPFTYFAIAEYDDETPHPFSGASNAVTVVR